MLRKLLIGAIVLALAALAFLKWGPVPAAIRVTESVLHPVFHKEVVDRHARTYREDPLFVTAVIKVESNFLKRAKSSRGAIGLMQIMPSTGRELAQDLNIRNFSDESLEDPETNIRIGTHYLARLRRELGDDDVLVLAAYNAGAKNAREWMKERGQKTLAIDDIEFGETRRFVHDVLKTYEFLKKAQAWRSRVMDKKS